MTAPRTCAEIADSLRRASAELAEAADRGSVALSTVDAVGRACAEAAEALAREPALRTGDSFLPPLEYLTGARKLLRQYYAAPRYGAVAVLCGPRSAEPLVFLATAIGHYADLLGIEEYWDRQLESEAAPNVVPFVPREPGDPDFGPGAAA